MKVKTGAQAWEFRWVSIPQSGFWWVEVVLLCVAEKLEQRFNPPVGILVG